ncbi:MAG: hypothetical protein HZA90_10065 [Verrucomicrobia bacterium]|nr:hypothetical protein [Verrucomicrobiota bacterium]
MKPLVILLLGTLAVPAQLAVTVSPPRIAGNKAVVPLAMKNHFAEKVESARAVVFLLDEHGKVAAQATRWVIGGINTNGLASGATNAFHFVLASDKPFTTTNLTPKVSFSRVVLEGGKLADVAKEVIVTPSTK